MGFGFSTRNFIEFSTNNLQYIERGVISLGGKNDLPFIIVQKTNSLFNKENFIITPICFQDQIILIFLNFMKLFMNN